MAFALAAFRKLEGLEQVADVMGITAVKRRQRIFDDALVLAAKTLGNELFQLRHVEIEHPRDQAEGVNVFALVLGRAADGFDGQRGNGNADMVIILLPLGLGLDVIGVVEHDAAFFERVDVAFTTAHRPAMLHAA